MHPAYSVIFFTTSSGAGYGLLFWLCAAQITGGLPESLVFRLVALALALVLISAGLLSSTFHLGHPERAWRALSQWRSSWLSREGVAAIVTYVPAALLGLFWIMGSGPDATVPAAFAAAIGALVTVYCSGMIYASLRTIPQWNQDIVPGIYLALSAASGAVLLDALLAVFGEASYATTLAASISLVGAFGLKRCYFERIDTTPESYTRAMALGLPGGAQVSALDPPHTRPNFVMREMGYEVGRRHAERLRALMSGLLFGLPLLCVVVAAFIGGAAPFLLVLAVLSVAVGLIIERWLFFAEAQHLSMLYYPR